MGTRSLTVFETYDGTTLCILDVVEQSSFGFFGTVEQCVLLRPFHPGEED